MWCVFHYSDDGSALRRTVERQRDPPNCSPAQASFDLAEVQRRRLDGKVEVRYSTEDERSASFAVESK